MKFQDVPAGRYPCRITDWSLTEVPQLDNALKVTIQVSMEVSGSAELIVGWWDGLAKKKDGTINEKTLKTLLSSGFKSTDIYSLATDGSSLDTTKKMEATVVKDDKGRTKIEWLNSEAGGALPKTTLKKKKDLVIEAALGKALKDKKAKKGDVDDGDELPF